jgi:4-diphosphocytidyl-2-C-methyl-D-erythritol kinase
MQIHAPAKLNLCLYLGARREDGLHELCSLFEPLALADLITLPTLTTPEVGQGRMGVDRDEVVCPGVEGENLVARALAALRERGWQHPPLRVEIEKRIPVAAGLGGGSADAAAVLRLAAGEVADLEQIAAALGADVPSQLTPVLALVCGAGERVERLPEPKPHAVVLLPGGGGLSTAEVFAEADRLGLGRADEELAELAQRLRSSAGAGASPLAYPELLVNDLEPAARSLRPEIGAALDALRDAGAPHALLTGSGPTAFGLFDTLAAAHAAANALDRDDAIVCEAGHAPSAKPERAT